MVNTGAIIVANCASVILMLTLLFNYRKALHTQMTDHRLFYLMVVLTITQSVLETLSFLVNGVDKLWVRQIALMMNSMLFINGSFFAFIWTVYVDFKLFGDKKRLSRIYPYLAIPAFIVAVLCIVNLFTPVFFEISEDNVYSRCIPLVYVTYAVTYLYLAYGVIMIYSSKEKRSRYMFLPALLFMLPIVIGTVLQLLFYGYSLMWLGVAVALISLYINVQNEVTYIDMLSGVFNRQYLMRYIEAEAKESRQKKLLAGIMLDIDKFKTINDVYGHITGDDAIRMAGVILLSCTNKPSIAARFAGDEFIVILRADNVSEVKELMNKISLKCDAINAEKKVPYTIRFSMGYAVFDTAKDTADTFIGRMDALMYEDKRRHAILPETADKK